jgi:HTH-type transcriptional regulator/antitoxin HipB
MKEEWSMPFKEINVSEVVKVKRKDVEFNEQYIEVEKEYKLIKAVVEMRKEKGITQKGLADMVGVSQQEISRFENEKHIPKLTNFIRILDALDLEIKLEKKSIVN